MFIKLLHEAYEKVPQQTAHQSDWWRSSSLGSCRRGTFLRRLFSGNFQIAIAPRLAMVFELGNIIEDLVIKKLLLVEPERWVLIQQGEVYDPVNKIKGHFDVLLIDKKTLKGYLGEVKSKNSMAFGWMDKKKEGAQQTHKYQLKSYIDIIVLYGFALHEDTPDDVRKWVEANLPMTKDKNGEQLFKVDLEYASILYVSKDDQRLLEYPIGISDTSLTQEWREEVRLLNHHWDTKTAPPMSDPKSWAGNGKYCDYCQEGLCKDLDDEKVKELFELTGK